MALTKISGNQISPSTEAIITTLSFLNGDSVLRLPAGTTEQQPEGVSPGTIRYNSSIDAAEIYVNDDGTGAPGWTDVGGGGASLGKDGMIRTNTNLIEEDILIDPALGEEFTNAFMAGPVSIASGFTVTVANGANFYVIGEQPETASYENINVFGVLNTHYGRVDTSAIRENLHSFRVQPSDNQINIDYHISSNVYVSGISQNFDINLTQLPITDINQGGADNNKLFKFKVMYYNTSDRFRPTGTIRVNGSSIGSAVWRGGVPGLNSNRHIVVDLTVVRLTEFTNTTGGTSTYWRSYIEFNEHN